MKKYLLLLLLLGCENPPNQPKSTLIANYPCRVDKITIDGQKFIVFQGIHCIFVVKDESVK